MTVSPGATLTPAQQQLMSQYQITYATKMTLNCGEKAPRPLKEAEESSVAKTQLIGF